MVYNNSQKHLMERIVTKIQLKLLDIPDISEQEWQDLLSLRTEFRKEANPGDPISSFETQRIELSSVREWQNLVQYWLIYDEQDTAVGIFVTVHPKPEHPDYETNKNILWINLYVGEAYRRQGIATQVLPKVVEQAQKFGANFIQSGTEIEIGWAFAESLGAEKALNERVSRMVMADTDWDMLQGWVDAGKARNPDVEIIRIERLPSEEDIEAYCQLITDLDEVIPFEDMEDEKYTLTVEELRKSTQRTIDRGHMYVALYAKDKDGSLMGMTGMFHEADVDTMGHVGLTGVLPKYQGRGLGKYLKALMSYDLRDNYPKVVFVDTENAESNAPMLSINERMNFKPHKNWLAYKVAVEDLMVKA